MDNVEKFGHDYSLAAPLLTFEQEQVLIPRAQQGCQRSRDQIINSNIRLVISIARHHHSPSLDHDDLIQEGLLGLIHAVKKFDTRRGIRFSTYATYWIRQSIVRAIQKEGYTIRLPSTAFIRAAVILRRKQEAEASDKPLDLEAVADELQTTTAMVQAILATMCGTLSLDCQTNPDDEDLFADTVATTAVEHDPQAMAVHSAEREALHRAVQRLGPLERYVVSERYGLGTGEAKTLREIAERINYSKQGTRDIVKRAIRALQEECPVTI